MYWIYRLKEDDLPPHPKVRAICHLAMSPQESCVTHNQLSLTGPWPAQRAHFQRLPLWVRAALGVPIEYTGHEAVGLHSPHPRAVPAYSAAPKPQPPLRGTSFCLAFLPQGIYIRDEGEAYHLKTLLLCIMLEDRI